MVLLLLAATLLYALLGSVFDSVVLLLSIVAVAAISVYQELRTSGCSKPCTTWRARAAPW